MTAYHYSLLQVQAVEQSRTCFNIYLTQLVYSRLPAMATNGSQMIVQMQIHTQSLLLPLKMDAIIVRWTIILLM